VPKCKSSSRRCVVYDNVKSPSNAFSKNQARSNEGAFGGSAPQIFLYPANFVVPRKLYFKHIIKTKIFPPKNVFFTPPKC